MGVYVWSIIVAEIGSSSCILVPCITKLIHSYENKKEKQRRGINERNLLLKFNIDSGRISG